ncbi:RluA family pseudouridine synthase [Candidatus Collierbacteria bacterium]|nr:RluA family pseudouridine synthase [Candidatus Collierbacteria bacterium]
MLNLTILWEDHDMMVINKPPFVVVNRAESIRGETVQDWADRHCEECTHEAAIHTNTGSPHPFGVRDDEEVFRKRSGVAHRLDKETSGCLLIAKNPAALKSLLQQFHDRLTKKEYLALVHGHLTPESGTIRLPLARSRFDREKWEIRYSGKMAETTWEVKKYFVGTTLVRLFPRTGRTHQIRVHLAHMGFPIFSDEKYLTRGLVAGDRLKLPFHFLHAQKIGFRDMAGEWQSIEAPLPEDAAKLLLLMESE